MLGCLTNLDNSRARAYCVVDVGGGCLDIFSLVFFYLFFSLGDDPTNSLGLSIIHLLLVTESFILRGGIKKF